MRATFDWEQRLQLDGEVRIAASRWRLAGLVGLYVALFLLGLFLWVETDANRLMAALTMGIFSLGAILLLWRIARPSFIVVTRSGISDGKRDYSWTDLVVVEVLEVRRSKSVLLRLDDAAADRLASSSAASRVRITLDAAFLDGPAVNLPGLFARTTELVAWLESVRQRHAGQPTPF